MLGVLGVLNGLCVLHVLHVLDMLMDASLACWALFLVVSVGIVSVKLCQYVVGKRIS